MPKPRVVPAGVPSRTPDVTNGEAGSNGTAFLLHVIPARPSAASAALPVTPLPCRSTSTTWVSVPPDTTPSPPSTSTEASADALSITCCA